MTTPRIRFPAEPAAFRVASSVPRPLSPREHTRSALNETVRVLYAELQHIAQVQRARWNGDDSLDTTALCHEAYLKLAGQNPTVWEEQAHFLSIASRTMRQILIDYSRAKRCEKRGGHDRTRVPLEVAEAFLPSLADLDADRADELLALDVALRALEIESPRHARIVECRFFIGMTIRETAEVLDLSPTSVKRGWSLAQAWLHQRMNGDVKVA